MDNCVTHHICFDKPLVVTLHEVNFIDVRRATGSTVAEGIGNFSVTITDSDGKKHNINIYNVI